MTEFDLDSVYITARKFAEDFSNAITVQDETHQTILINGVEYPCVPLRFFAKGNNTLYEDLLASGCCTKMDGGTEGGKRIRRVLLWIEKDCENVHRITEEETEIMKGR